MPELQRLVCAVMSGDMTGLWAIKDYLEETGEKMLPLEEGRTYLIETKARWYLLGTVKKNGGLWLEFGPACQVNNMPDMSSVVGEGHFAEGTELVPAPNGAGLAAWDVATWFPFPWAVPTQRTHARVE